MEKIALIRLIFFYAWVALSTGVAQSMEHPVIWSTADDRDGILELVESQEWAKGIVNQLHQRVDQKMAIHQIHPDAILNQIPPFPKHNHELQESQASPLAAGHHQVLSVAADAGMLYYLTGNEAYATFSADILAAYIDVLAPRSAKDTTICGYAFFDPRTAYGSFALAYDFIHSYLTGAGATVYHRESGQRVPFDNAKAQQVIANMVGSTLQEYGPPDEHGKVISNHPILTAPGVLFGILCIEDDLERERLLKVFWETGTFHQNSFKHTILPMFGEQGIWPESTSYSFMSAITMVLNILDRIYPEMDITTDYHHILEGNFLFDNLRYPDRRFVRYGDSKRNNDSTGSLYRYTLSLAERRGLEEFRLKAQIALRQAYDEIGGYHPKLSGNIFNNYEALQLFWGGPIPEQVEGSIDFRKPTVLVTHAGIALQRNYVEKDNEVYGLCGIIGGASYVHSHLTGIAMELYGANYVMGPNAGLPATVSERRIPLHENYFRLYAGNNTVVVNGTSHGLQEGSWKDGAYVWQNTCTNIACEPSHLQDPISEHFSFATQSLHDEVNDVVQERTLGIVRTSPTTAYYVDMFRSRSLDENRFHDYIYHNIGDTTRIAKQSGDALVLSPTDRYDNDIGDPVGSPGWRYFEEEKASSSTDAAVHIQFQIHYDDHSMHLFVPNGVQREYTLALAPPSREARNGYVKKKTQVLAIRQQGEAWERPYIAVFEPSNTLGCSVTSVRQLTSDGRVVGAVVVSRVGNQTITDTIICQDRDDAIVEDDRMNLFFKGRYGLIRQTQSDGATAVALTMYIGRGETLRFNGYELKGNDLCKGVLVVEGHSKPQ